METHRSHRWLPVLTFFVMPIIILLVFLLGCYFLNQCLTSTKTYTDLQAAVAKAEVMGVATFDVVSSKDQVIDGETFNYTATLSSDNQLGVLTSSIVFQLTGEGRIGEDVSGPGVCVRVSELRATCTGINILPEETLVWTIPVTAKTDCSDSASPTLSLVATHSAVGLIPEVSEDTGIVTCVSANPGTDDDDDTVVTPVSNDTTTNTNTTNTSGDDDSGTISDGLTAVDVLAFLDQHNEEVQACYTAKMTYLGVGLLVLFLVTLLTFFMARGQDTKIVTKDL